MVLMPSCKRPAAVPGPRCDPAVFTDAVRPAGAQALERLRDFRPPAERLLMFGADAACSSLRTLSCAPNTR